MTAGSAAKRIVEIALVLLSAGMVWVVASGTGELRRLDRSIAEQEAIIDSLTAEQVNLDIETREAGEAIGELPESSRLGEATRRGWEIAKREEIIAGLTTRARARVRNYEKAKGRARSNMARLAVPLAAGWVVLMAGRWMLGRRFFVKS
jgi:hypothetical protein